MYLALVFKNDDLYYRNIFIIRELISEKGRLFSISLFDANLLYEHLDLLCLLCFPPLFVCLSLNILTLLPIC